MFNKENPLNVINNSGHKLNYNWYPFYNTQKKFYKINLENQWTGQIYEIEVQWPWQKIEVSHAIVENQLSIDILCKDVINQWRREHQNQEKQKLSQDLLNESNAEERKNQVLQRSEENKNEGNQILEREEWEQINIQDEEKQNDQNIEICSSQKNERQLKRDEDRKQEQEQRFRQYRQSILQLNNQSEEMENQIEMVQQNFMMEIKNPMHIYKEFTQLKYIDFEECEDSVDGQILIKTRSNPNSCYMNTVIQCLSNTFPLYQYFLNFKLFQQDLPFENNDHPSIIVEYISIINQLWNKNEQQINKNLFAKYVSEKNKKFAPGVQNDSQEFLVFLLNEFKEQLNRLKNKRNLMENLDQQNQLILLQKCQNVQKQAYFLKYQSIIDDLFNVDLLFDAQCNQCLKRILRLQKSLTLNVEVPQNQQNVKLEQCIENSFKQYNLSEQSQYKCNACDQNGQETNINQKIYRLGPILIICLQRFQQGQKNDCLVDFPTENLKMNKFVQTLKDEINQANEEQYTYDLYATINHEYQNGNTSKGNYYSICYNFKLNSWILFNDRNQNPKVIAHNKIRNQLINQSAYILFYRQKNFIPQEKNCIYAIQIQSYDQYDDIIFENFQDFNQQDQVQKQIQNLNLNLIDQSSDDEDEKEEFEVINDANQFLKNQIPKIQFDQEEFFNLSIKLIQEQIKILKKINDDFVYPKGLRENGFRQQQIMAIKAIFYSSNDDILLQVKPGEGKTIIIAAACILIILNMKKNNIDKKIDIMTSSEYLAIENFKENCQLFEAFEISCGCAVQNEIEDIAIMKKIYSKQIVYSTTFKAQSDYIRHQYLNDGRRGDRDIKQSLIIVDEVDNMFLDKCTQSCILSKPAPGFGYLNEILVIIFQLTSKYIEINDKWFQQITFGQLQEEDIDISKDVQNIIDICSSKQQISRNYECKNELIKSIKYQEVNLVVQQNDFKWQEFSPQNIGFNECKYCIAVYNNQEFKILKLLNKKESIQYLKNHLETSIDGFQIEEEEDLEETNKEMDQQEEDKREELNEEEKEREQEIYHQNIIERNLNNHFGQNEINYYVPQVYVPYIKQNINKLIENAVRARSLFIKDKDYVIDIIGNEAYLYIVDYQNTGEIQMNTQWSDGLHQFICLKEKIPLQDLNISYIHQSSFSFYKSYENIIGLSGTLGDEIDRCSLKDNYQLNLFDIPPHMPSKFQKHKSLVFINEDEWKDKLIQMIYEISQKQAVLVICESICNSEYLNEQFEQLQDNKEEKERRKTKKFNRGDDEQQQKTVEEKVEIGNVIFATNVGARGADFKISQELNNNGGMHVIITFLPQNKRVQDQAFLRTARAGNKGSGQLVYVSPIQNLSNKSNIGHRNMISISLLDENRKQLSILQKQDDLFENFINNKDQLVFENEEKKKFIIIDKQVTYGIRQLQNIQDENQDLLKEIFNVETDQFLNPFIQIQYANKLLKKYLKTQYDDDQQIQKYYKQITEKQKQEYIYFPAYINFGIYLLIKFQSQKNQWTNYDKDKLLQGVEYFEKGLFKMKKVIERGSMIAALIESKEQGHNLQNQNFQKLSSMSQYFVDKLLILNQIHYGYSQKLKEVVQKIKDGNYFQIRIKSIENYFENNKSNQKIFNELEQFGIIGMIDIQYKNDKLQLYSLGLIASLQIVSGYALKQTGLGYIPGGIIFKEGLNDLQIFLNSFILNQEFSKNKYLIDKCINIAFSIFGAASAQKNVSLVKNMQKQAVKQSLFQQGIDQIKKQAQKIGIIIIKQSGSQLAKIVSKFVQENISKIVKEYMVKKINEQILQSQTNILNRKELLFQLCVLHKDDILIKYFEEQNELIDKALSQKKFWDQAFELFNQMSFLVKDHLNQYQNNFDHFNPSQVTVFSCDTMKSLQGICKASQVIETFQHNYKIFSKILIKNREIQLSKIGFAVDDAQLGNKYTLFVELSEKYNQVLNNDIQEKILDKFDILIQKQIIYPILSNFAQKLTNQALNSMYGLKSKDFKNSVQDLRPDEIQQQQINNDIFDALYKRGQRSFLALGKEYIKKQLQFEQIKENDIQRAIRNLNFEVEMIQLKISTKKINLILKYSKQKGYLTSTNILVGNQLFQDLKNNKIDFEGIVETQKEKEILIDTLMHTLQSIVEISERIFSSDFLHDVFGDFALEYKNALQANHQNQIKNFIICKKNSMKQSNIST